MTSRLKIKHGSPHESGDNYLDLLRKYQGRRLVDLPGHYLGWFAREGFPRGELGRLLALMYEIDHNDLRSLLLPLRRRS